MSVEKLNLRIVALGMMAAGFVMMFFTKRRKFKSPGKAIFGFGLVFLALTLLSSGATTLKESETAAQALAALGENPLLGVFVGVVATFLVHSSSTTVAMNLALAQAGLLNIEASLALILGDNIGTCLTAQIAALGTSIPARRTAWAHTLHNVIGVMLALAFFPLLVKFALWISPEIVRQIAFTHGLFNVASALSAAHRTFCRLAHEDGTRGGGDRRGRAQVHRQAAARPPGGGHHPSAARDSEDGRDGPGDARGRHGDPPQ